MARFLGGIWLIALVVLGGFGYLEIREERTRLVGELERRGALVAAAVAQVVERLPPPESGVPLEPLFVEPGLRARAVAIYDGAGELIAGTRELSSFLHPHSRLIADALRRGTPVGALRQLGPDARWIHVTPIVRAGTPGALAVALDAGEVEARVSALWRHTAYGAGILLFSLTAITLVFARASVTAPIARMAEWTRQLKAGRPIPLPPGADARVLAPVVREVAGLARTLTRARLAAEEEARLRLHGESVWTEERLKQFVLAKFGTTAIFVVSNREPLSHVRQGKAIVAVQPASGLVTAMEPVMKACGGVWVAHGSGDADRVAGERVALPADDPSYTLRRVWLGREEELGYYDGFANEGLWPLCHIVHERPQFRESDWAHYRHVNRKFANVLLEEMEKSEAPIVLVQDYHFALLPQMLKQGRPDARVALFWHIPWPNVEVFGICPWQEAILDGMLAADVVGFHTQFHCNNFLETVERTIEGRVEWHQFTVRRGRHVTHVRPFPISVAPADDDAPACEAPRAEGPLDVDYVGVGVERVDYTKGLPERFRAIRRFFERWPRYRRRLTFVQIAAPSRSQIARYRELQREVEALARAINEEIGDDTWQPIDYRGRQHSREEVAAVYRRASFCMVTSLHDGMNLVAKEFIAAREDEAGVLILSRFAGAAHDLREALLVNPYDVEGMAERIRQAVEMPADEQQARMRRMRREVRENNIYRWTGMLLAELGHLPDSELYPTD